MHTQRTTNPLTMAYKSNLLSNSIVRLNELHAAQKEHIRCCMSLLELRTRLQLSAHRKPRISDNSFVLAKKHRCSIFDVDTMWENFKRHQEKHSKVQREHSFRYLYLFTLLQYFWIYFLLPLRFEYLFYCHLFSLNCCDNLLELQTKENHTVLERHSSGVNWWIDGSMNIHKYIYA